MGHSLMKRGYIQFILCDSNGEFYKTDSAKGYYKLYDITTMEMKG